MCSVRMRKERKTKLVQDKLSTCVCAKERERKKDRDR